MIRPPDLSDVEREIAEVQHAKETAVEQQQFEKAASLRDKEKNLKHKLEEVLSSWKQERQKHEVTIDVNDVRYVVSKMSGIPMQRIEEGEAERLLRMEKDVRQTVIGQDDGVSAICRALRRSRADLKDPQRPIGSFIFLGPSGVGKTLLAKALAEFMFGDPDALIRIDMSEYMEKFNVSRLVGSPPGYVGHGEGGQLTERVRRRPYAVVLFDEVEKAHPDVMHMLLQILEEGQLTDSLGFRVNFRNTVVIMTSNVGAADIQRHAVGLFHLEGVTPEAPKARTELCSGNFKRSDIDSLSEGYAALSTGRGRGRIDMVAIGCPHASIEELQLVKRLLRGRRAQVPFWIFVSEKIRSDAREDGLAAELEKTGVRLVADTCLVVAPVKELGIETAATNSAKMAFYLPSHHGVAVHFGSTEDNVEAAVSGTWGRGG